MSILRRLISRTAQLTARTLTITPAALAVAVSVTPVAATQTADKSMTVFVTASESAPQGKATEADRQQAATAMKAAQNTRKDLETNLKAQFGNKRDKWPADARERYADAEEAELRLNTDWLYRSGGSAPLPRNVPDLKDAIQGVGLAGKKDNVVVVGTREEAQLIVELNAVRTANTADADTLNDQFWIQVLIKRGPRLSAEQFATVPRTYRFPLVTRLAAPSDEAPWWRFEATGTFLWSAPAKLASRLVEDFIAKNRDILLAAGPR
jgi:hypothetical protein